MKFPMLIFCLMIMGQYCFGQHSPTWSLSYQHGRILKHRKIIAYDIPSLTPGFQLQWTAPTNSSAPWYLAQGRPEWGIALGYMHLGNNDVLGQAYYVAPYMRYLLARERKVQGWVEIGTGLAYLSKFYDATSNPLNNAMGSHFNNTTQVRFGARTRLSNTWQLSSGIALTHFSNGGFQLPNLGMNLIAAELKFSRLSPNKAIPQKEMSNLLLRKWGADLQLSQGYREISTINGPKWSIQNLRIGGYYRLSASHRLFMGYGYENQPSVYRMAQQQALFDDKKAKSQSQFHFALFGFESNYGPVSVSLTTGRYLGNYWQPPSQWANYLTLRYYPLQHKASSVQPFIGMGMKSHVVTAEYIFAMVGTSW